MRWLNSIEQHVLEYVATVPFEERKLADPFKKGTPEDLAFDVLAHRGLVVPAHCDQSGITYILSGVAILIRSALKVKNCSI